jgi:hypothetical protein
MYEYYERDEMTCISAQETQSLSMVTAKSYAQYNGALMKNASCNQ